MIFTSENSMCSMSMVGYSMPFAQKLLDCSEILQGGCNGPLYVDYVIYLLWTSMIPTDVNEYCMHINMLKCGHIPQISGFADETSGEESLEDFPEWKDSQQVSHLRANS